MFLAAHTMDRRSLFLIHLSGYQASVDPDEAGNYDILTRQLAAEFEALVHGVFDL